MKYSLFQGELFLIILLMVLTNDIIEPVGVSRMSNSVEIWPFSARN